MNSSKCSVMGPIFKTCLSLMAASLILTACASSTGQFYERAGLIDPPVELELACPKPESLTDGRCATCYILIGTEAEKYANCRTEYAALAERQKILLFLMSDAPDPRRRGFNWKFWQRGD